MEDTLRKNLESEFEFESCLTIHRNKWFWGYSEYVIYGHGQGIIHIQYQDDYSDIAVFSGLSVIPDYRKTGLGKKLLEYAEKLAFKNGCTKIELSAEKDSWIVEWYKRMGYKIVDKFREESFYEDILTVSFEKCI